MEKDLKINKFQYNQTDEKHNEILIHFKLFIIMNLILHFPFNNKFAENPAKTLFMKSNYTFWKDFTIRI